MDTVAFVSGNFQVRPQKMVIFCWLAGDFAKFIWLVVWTLPLWKIWLRQLGLWNSQLNGKIKAMSKPPTSHNYYINHHFPMIFPRLSHGFPMVPNHQPVIDILSKHLEDFSATAAFGWGWSLIPAAVLVDGRHHCWCSNPLYLSIYLLTIYLSIYLSIYLYIYICMCIYIYVYVYIYIYVYMCVYIYVVSILMCVLHKSAYCWISWKLPHEISLTSWPGSISMFQHTIIHNCYIVGDIVSYLSYVYIYI